MSDTLKRGLEDPSLIVYYGASSDILSSLDHPPLSKSNKEIKRRTIYIYGSRLSGIMFFSFAPLHPKIIETLDLKLFNIDTLYGKIKRRSLRFYIGSKSEFPDTVRTTKDRLSFFTSGKFNLCPSIVSDVFIWSRSNMRAFTVENEGGFEYVRNHHIHEILRDYFQTDILLSIDVEPKRPNLRLVSDNVNS